MLVLLLVFLEVAIFKGLVCSGTVVQPISGYSRYHLSILGKTTTVDASPVSLELNTSECSFTSVAIQDTIDATMTVVVRWYGLVQP